MQYSHHKNTPEQIDRLLSEIFNYEPGKYFSDQAILCNHRLFQHIIGVRNYLFVDKYSIVQQYLVSQLRSQGLLRQIFSNKTILSELSEEDGSGLFWVNDNTRQKKVILLGSKLISQDGNFICNIDNLNQLSELLELKKLVISMTLMFCILNFYCGMECLGGVSQIKYLGEMRKKWVAVMNTLGLSKDAEYIQSMWLNRLIGGFRMYSEEYGSFDFLANNWRLDQHEISRAAKEFPPITFFPISKFLERNRKTLS